MFLEEEHFKTRKWQIDCPEMTLSDGSEQGRREHRGAGFVRSTEDGGLEFKLLSSEQLEPRYYVDRMLRGEAGTLVKEEEFFDLRVRDLEGRIWTARRLHLDLSAGETGHVWAGKLKQIECVEARQRVGIPPYLRVAFYGKFEVPCNVATHSEDKVDERVVTKSVDWNIAKEKISRYDLTARCEEDHLVIDMQCSSSDEVIPRHLAARLEETLEFLYGQPMRAAVIETNEGGTPVKRLRGFVLDDEQRYAMPPVHVERYGARPNFWRLFAALLQHLESFTESSRPPLSRCIQYLLVNRASIDLQSLSWASGVEALLRDESTGQIDPDFASALDELSAWIDTCRFLPKTKKRLHGMVGSKRAPSADEKLRALLTMGAISSQQHKDWKDVRHSSAHGATHHLDDEWLRECGGVRTLAHCLVFHKVGYTGEFIDYGARGWPKRPYPFRKGTLAQAG